MPTFVTAHTFCASLFLRVVPTNTEFSLHGLKLHVCEESRTEQMLLVSKRKFGVTMNFSEIIKLQFEKKNAIHCFVFYCFFFFFVRIIVA